MKLPGRMLPEVFRTFLKPPVTVRYPYVRVDMPKDFRGRIVFDAKLCIGCKMCMRDCPSKAIVIEKVGENKVFKATFYLDRCLYCAQCVDSCPKDALKTSPNFELAKYKREDLLEIQS